MQTDKHVNVESEGEVVNHSDSLFGCATMILALGITLTLIIWALSGFPGLR